MFVEESRLTKHDPLEAEMKKAESFQVADYFTTCHEGKEADTKATPCLGSDETGSVLWSVCVC